MTVALQAIPQFFDNAGIPLSGGKIFSYEAGTLIPLPTYTDRAGLTPNANPVILDAAGRADIWLTANVAFKLILQDAAGTVMDSVDQFYAGADPSQLVAAGIVPATGGAYTGPVSFAGGATFDGTETQDLATLNSLGIAAVQNANLWTNSDFEINQRGVGGAVDGLYGVDRTVMLCEGGAMTYSQLAQPADGIPYALRLTQSVATAQRIGVVQILEARSCLAYRGKQLVFAPKVRASVGTTIRVALVAWVGTQDAPPRDLVNNWASTTYTAGNFFIANTLTIAVGAAAVSAATWADVPVSSASAGGVVVPSNMNNLYMVVWTDQAQAQSVTVDLSVMRAGQGTNIPLWTPTDPALEQVKCQRYFQLVSLGIQSVASAGGQIFSTNATYPVLMRGTPLNAVFITGISSNTSGATLVAATNRNIRLDITSAAAGQLAVVDFVYSLNAELGV